MQVLGFYGILVKREPLCKSYFDIYRLECPILFFGIDYFLGDHVGSFISGYKLG